MKLIKKHRDKEGIVFDKDTIDQIFSYCQPSRCYSNVLDDHQIKELVDFMFRKTISWRTSLTGNLFFKGNFKTLVEEIVYPAIKDIVYKDDIDWSIVDTVAGNFFHTPHQYGLHTDMPEISSPYSRHVVPYRSLLIPLYVLAPKNHVSHMIYYNQRILNNGCTLDYGSYKSTTHYTSYTDYSQIQNVYTLDGPCNIDTTNKMSTEEFIDAGLDKAPSPIERYNGLSVENSFEWCPGDLHTFDTCQVHNSTLGNPQFKTKAGLRIMLLSNKINN